MTTFVNETDDCTMVVQISSIGSPVISRLAHTPFFAEYTIGNPP